MYLKNRFQHAEHFIKTARSEISPFRRHGLNPAVTSTSNMSKQFANAVDAWNALDARTASKHQIEVVEKKLERAVGRAQQYLEKTLKNLSDSTNADIARAKKSQERQDRRDNAAIPLTRAYSRVSARQEFFENMVNRNPFEKKLNVDKITALENVEKELLGALEDLSD